MKFFYERTCKNIQNPSNIAIIKLRIIILNRIIICREGNKGVGDWRQKDVVRGGRR